MMESQIYMKIVRLLYYLPMERMSEEELENLKNFKVYVFEWEVYVKAEDYKEMAIENKKLKEENEKLKKENISLHLEIEDLKDDGELSYEEKLLYD